MGSCINRLPKSWEGFLKYVSYMGLESGLDLILATQVFYLFVFLIVTFNVLATGSFLIA
jgi:hypothetical protein